MTAPAVFPSSRIGIPTGGRYGGRLRLGVSLLSLGGGYIMVESNTAEGPERVPSAVLTIQWPGPASSVYCGVAPLSLGGTPMTFTPAWRAMSMAKITSWYFTFGSPLMKISLSGRGS